MTEGGDPFSFSNTDIFQGIITHNNSNKSGGIMLDNLIELFY